MYRFYLLFVMASIVQIICLAQGIDSVNNNDKHIVDHHPVLIINSFDAMAIPARNNKKDLFRELTDSLKSYLATSAAERLHVKITVIPDILQSSDSLDGSIFDLMKEKKADKAILIRSLDTYFTETSTREDRNEDGKLIMITSYDICAKIEYAFYIRDSVADKSASENCRFFTTRSVRGRLGIGFGPDIVGKRKHTYKMVAQNADNYISKMSEELTQ